MRRLTLFLSFCCFFSLLSQKTNAQIGINAGYQINETDSWISENTAQSVVANGYKAGIDYWFRLKNKRIEFTPELSYAFYKSLSSTGSADYKVEFFNFQLNTNIYLLDLLNDCNCPTFSKQNNFIQKGFFIRVAPGVSLPRFQQTRLDLDANSGDLQPMLALGLGLDIGLSDLLTISPILTANYLPNVEWRGPDPLAMNAPNADFWQINAGIRLGFRFDDY